MTGKLLITGATGFIGAKLTEYYVGIGVLVRLLVRDAGKLNPALKGRCEIVTGDINRPETLAPALQGVEAIIHAAGLLGRWGMPYRQLSEVNVTGAENLVCAACREGISRFIHLSAGGVTGPVGLQPADETWSPQPGTDYEKSKWEGERRVLEIAATNNLSLLVVRPTFTYGPGDPHKLELFRAVQKGRFVFIGDGLSTVSPVFIDDVVKGVDSGLNSDLRGISLIIAGPKPVSKRELVWGIANALEVKRPRFSIPFNAAMSAAKLCESAAGILRFQPLLTRSRVMALGCNWGYSCEKAVRLLGYHPEVDLARGLHLTVAWYRQQGWL